MYLILSMTMFPAIAILGSLFDIVRRLGLYNQLPALIITYLVFTLPFTVWVLTSFFQALPKELEEAAYVDGASPLETLYRVMLPLIAPGLVTTDFWHLSTPGTNFSSRFRSSRHRTNAPYRWRFSCSTPAPEE